MPDPTALVETKLYRPRVRVGAVLRTRLSDRLRRAAETRLTLVCAPAGFGKTTMLSAWLTVAAGEGRPGAWLSLEEADRPPAVFWTYLVTALDRAAPGVGTTALSLLPSGQVPIETVLTTLLNELSVLPHDLDLVLDDYHLAEGPDTQAGMVFLLDHLPPQVHLVISTRADPALPLARLRARGELVEVRAADLRFTGDEATAYFNGVVGLDLAAADVAALAGRTEGWIAALQLAALSMKGRPDVAGFVAGFAGDDRYVVDYLVEEVLDRQPAPARRFLLETSILDRLSGPLCDTVTGGRGGKAMLESLDRANLFVIPLDDSRRWYRYHQLFADVLRAHLLDERPDEITQLYRRASDWYHDGGEPVPAVRYALAAGDAEWAADLAELAIPTLRRDRQEATLLGWLDDIPEDIVRARPVLALGAVGAAMTSGQFNQAGPRLREIESQLDGPGRSDLVVADRDELARLPAQIEMYRAALALATGDPAATVGHAELAVARAADGDHLTLAAASALSGLASWASGDLTAAHRAYSVAVQGLRRIGHISDVLGCSITLADIASTQGRPSEARRTYTEALDLAGREPGPVLRGTADMYVGLSQLAWERNDLAAARRYLQQGLALGEPAGLPQNAYRWRVALARIREVDGDLAGAVDLLDEAQRVYFSDFSPSVRPVPALRARLLVALGNVDEALDWARHRNLSTEDELSYVCEYEHLTLARILLARNTTAARRDATALLDRLLAAAEAGGRGGSVIEILVLQALARQAGGDATGALRPLDRALALAEPEGYVRVFVGEGPAMVAMLRSASRRRDGQTYRRQLLDADLAPPGRSADGDSAEAGPAGLIEPLSERELDVLRLLATDLDGPAIARHLVVSLNTVRTHTKHIYAKLGVNSRRAAVGQAHRLSLLAGRHHPAHHMM